MTGSLTCPFCGSADIEMVARWGGQLITSQVRCRGCNTYFEALRDAFDPEGGSATEAGTATEAGSDGGR